MFNPWKKEIAFLKSVNKICALRDTSPSIPKFFIYRTIEGKVMKYELYGMGINLETGELTITFGSGDRFDEFFNEKASKLDLQLISDVAQKQAQALRK